MGVALPAWRWVQMPDEGQRANSGSGFWEGYRDRGAVPKATATNQRGGKESPNLFSRLPGGPELGTFPFFFAAEQSKLKSTHFWGALSLTHSEQLR